MQALTKKVYVLQVLLLSDGNWILIFVLCVVRCSVQTCVENSFFFSNVLFLFSYHSQFLRCHHKTSERDSSCSRWFDREWNKIRCFCSSWMDASLGSVAVLLVTEALVLFTVHHSSVTSRLWDESHKSLAVVFFPLPTWQWNLQWFRSPEVLWAEFVRTENNDITQRDWPDVPNHRCPKSWHNSNHASRLVAGHGKMMSISFQRKRRGVFGEFFYYLLLIIIVVKYKN